MKIRNGVDLAEVSRFEKAYERHGEAFYERFMRERELRDCTGGDGALRHASAAARYAAKEAFSKALGTGIAEGVALRDIEIVRDEKGAPFYVLHGEALARLKAEGFTEASLSLSHDGDYAVAFCILYAE